MTTVVIADGGEQSGEEPAAPVAEAEAVEAAAEAAPEVAETVTEAAVEIAEIEAGRDIAIAGIHADQEQAFAETLRDDRIANLEREVTECRTRAETAEAELFTAQAMIQSLTQPSSPPEVIAEASPEGVSVEVTPEHQEGQEEAAPVEPVRKEPKFRWI